MHITEVLHKNLSAFDEVMEVVRIVEVAKNGQHYRIELLKTHTHRGAYTVNCYIRETANVPVTGYPGDASTWQQHDTHIWALHSVLAAEADNAAQVLQEVLTFLLDTATSAAPPT